MVSRNYPSRMFDLPQPSWLADPAVQVAPRLLGCLLWTQIDGILTAGIVSEVEAYAGTNDPASHAFRGLTPRTAPMFLAGGHVYVYLSYGLHRCINIVTGAPGDAQAVLIRSIQPLYGLDQMCLRRFGTPTVKTKSVPAISNGPGKTAQALGIMLTDSGSSLGTRIGVVEPPVTVRHQHTIAGPRIGIRQAQEFPWRFQLLPADLKQYQEYYNSTFHTC